jgi:thiamine pyrophosphate-dependent acetolactate synthase large subunit-like protein
MGDVKATLEALSPLLKEKKSDKHLRACLEKTQETQKKLDRYAEASGDSGRIAPDMSPPF